MTDASTARPRRRKAPPTDERTAAPAGATGAVAAGADDGAVDLGSLAEATGFLLKRAQMAVFNDFIRAFAAEDIRPAQYSVLTIIQRNPGLKQSQVSEALSIKRTNFVPLLDTLENRGLVRRRPAAGDRRSYALHLTAKGEALTKRLTALWLEHEARVRERIGEAGRVQLLELLGRLVELGGPLVGPLGADDAEATDAVSEAADARRRQGGSPRR